MTPAAELSALEQAIAQTEQELAAAREALDAAATRLVLDGDSDGLGAARVTVAALRDRLDELYSREAVLKFRIGQEAA